MNNIFPLDGLFAYVITDTDDGCFISDCHGTVMEAAQMKYLAKRLLETAKNKGGEIAEANKRKQIELDRMMNGRNSTPKEPKRKKAAYVYMLECGGRYKIGFSCDVGRRAAELDKRPFPVNIIAVSKATENAFEEEQYIHERLEHLRINGEWYEISHDGAERVKKYIERIF